MKYIVLILSFIVMISGFSSCAVHEPGRPHRVFKFAEYRTRNHFGAPRHQSNHDRYWGRHRYGPRPHWHRGHYR